MKSQQELRGFFCVIEGINASGKSTLLKNLAKRLAENAGIPILGDANARDAFMLSRGREAKPLQPLPHVPACLLTREPTDGALGQEIRRRLTTETPTSQKQWLQLFMKDRWQHQQRVLQPFLQMGCLILTDRYYYSSAAYQGNAYQGKQIDNLSRSHSQHDSSDATRSKHSHHSRRTRTPKSILRMHERLGYYAPDLVFYVRMKPQGSLRRQEQMQHKPDIHENLSRLAQIYSNYELIFTELLRGQQTFHTIEANDNDVEQVSLQCYQILIERILKRYKDIKI